MRADVLRFRPTSAPYRRGGLAFASISDWIERGPGEIEPREVAVLAADPSIEIQGREHGDADWEPMPAAVRALGEAQLAMLAPEDWAEIAAEVSRDLVGQAANADAVFPPAMEVKLIDTLSAAIEALKPELFVLGIDVDGDVLCQLIDLATACNASVAEMTAAAADYRLQITALGEEIDQLRETHTPPDDSQDGGAGDGAGPAGDTSSTADVVAPADAGLGGGGGEPAARPVAKGGKSAKRTAD